MSTSALSGAGGLGNLGRLPPELRLDVYELTLSRKTAVYAWRDPVWRSCRWRWPVAMRHVEFTDGLALLAVSKQVYDEAIRSFFNCNTIKFNGDRFDQIQEFSRLPYLKHMKILYPDTRDGWSGVNIGDMALVPNMLSAIQAFSHGATSLRSISLSLPFHTLLRLLRKNFHALDSIIIFEHFHPWRESLQHLLEEAGVATAEEFLKKTFRRDVV